MSRMQQGKRQTHARRDACMFSQDRRISKTRERQITINCNTISRFSIRSGFLKRNDSTLIYWNDFIKSIISPSKTSSGFTKKVPSAAITTKETAPTILIIVSFLLCFLYSLDSSSRIVLAIFFVRSSLSIKFPFSLAELMLMSLTNGKFLALHSLQSIFFIVILNKIPIKNMEQTATILRKEIKSPWTNR